MQIQISVANLVPRVQIAANGEAYFLGIFNRRDLEKGKRRITALGGGAHMTTSGKALLEQVYGAKMTSDDPMDARFLTDEKHLEDIIAMFKRRGSEVYEIEPSREVVKELTTRKSFPPPFDVTPLEMSDLDGIQFLYSKTVQQNPSNQKSGREIEGVKTVRLFNLFTLVGTSTLVQKLQACPVIRFVTEEQIRRVMAGESLNTDDGVVIGDNIVW